MAASRPIPSPRRRRTPRPSARANPPLLALVVVLIAKLAGRPALLPVTSSQETAPSDGNGNGNGGDGDGATHTISAFDCVDPNNREVASLVRRGEITTVCLYVGPGGDWNSNATYKRFSVNLQADEFSSYSVPGSFKALAGESNMFNSDASHVFAASQSSLSFLRRYYDRTTQRIYPFLTAIIDVRDGEVRGIAWDDACVFCEMSECVPNTYNFDGSLATTEQISQPTNGCFYSRDECAGFFANGNDVCDLKLHVVWTGTDVNGKVLLSSDSRFSMFPPDRTQEKARGSYESMIENLKNIKDKVTGSG